MPRLTALDIILPRGLGEAVSLLDIINALPPDLTCLALRYIPLTLMVGVADIGTQVAVMLRGRLPPRPLFPCDSRLGDFRVGRSFSCDHTFWMSPRTCTVPRVVL